MLNLNQLVQRFSKAKRRQLILPMALEKLDIKLITSNQLLNHEQQNGIFLYGSQEVIVGNIPCSINDEIPGIVRTRMLREHTLRQPFILEVENAQVVGHDATGFDANGNIIGESLGPPALDLELRLEELSPHTLILQKFTPVSTTQLDAVCSLVNCWSASYFHWIIDTLTRIEGFEYYQSQTGCKPILMINSKPKSWQIESLRLLGYEADSYIHWNPSAAKVNVKQLVIPSFRRQGDWISPEVCHWLRQRMLRKLAAINQKQLPLPTKIFISRFKATGRRIINEDEVMEVLQPLGFVKCVLEDMSFIDQVKLFSTAEMVIAPHGAGLTNIIFSPTNLMVVELFNSWYTPCYFALSAALNFRYGCLKCQDFGHNLRGNKQDMIVNTIKLRQLLTKMLDHREPK
jgi:hypothetical protein